MIVYAAQGDSGRYLDIYFLKLTLFSFLFFFSSSLYLPLHLPISATLDITTTSNSSIVLYTTT